MGEYKTPGVYIKEKNAFGNSIVEVETAVPVFIGLTEVALDGTSSLLNKPVRISSMTEYCMYFGGAPHLSSCFPLKILRRMTRINFCLVFLIMKRKRF